MWHAKTVTVRAAGPASSTLRSQSPRCSVIAAKCPVPPSAVLRPSRCAVAPGASPQPRQEPLGVDYDPGDLAGCEHLAARGVARTDCEAVEAAVLVGAR